jgi:hypothetical protein
MQLSAKTGGILMNKIKIISFLIVFTLLANSSVFAVSGSSLQNNGYFTIGKPITFGYSPMLLLLYSLGIQ